MNESTSLTRLVIVCSLLFTVAFGCATPARENVAPNTDRILEYKHGAKLLVQYEPTKNQTTVYHYIPANGPNHKLPPLKPDLIVGAQQIKGRHSFELFDTVSFSGRKPSTEPTNTSLSITHSISNRKEWHFPANAKVIIIVDGTNIPVPVYSQIELKKDDPSDAEFYEVLITKPTYEMYSKMADAKGIKVQIGSAFFDLDSESIVSYRDFLGHLKPTSN